MLSAFADGRLFGVRTGDRPNVLALHGWRGSHSQMTGIVSGTQAISLDLPGFGASPVPEQTWGAADYARCALPILEELEAPRVIVGYSFGGRIAVNIAAMAPEKVDALVLTGVPLIRRDAPGKPALGYRMLRRAHRLGLVSDERMEAEKKRRGSADYRAATGIMRDIFVKLVNESYEEQLSSLTMPVELVWGESDTEAPLWVATAAKEIVPHAKLTVVPGADHWFVSADAAPVRDAIARCNRKGH